MGLTAMAPSAWNTESTLSFQPWLANPVVAPRRVPRHWGKHALMSEATEEARRKPAVTADESEPKVPDEPRALRCADEDQKSPCSAKGTLAEGWPICAASVAALAP